MDEARLAEIEARLKAALDAPWQVHVLEGNGYDVLFHVEPQVLLYDVNGRLVLDDDWDGNPHRPATGALIAHASEDLRDLLAEVRRLRGEDSDSASRLALRGARAEACGVAGET